MRIGIVTFHQALNYGAILQTYALQKHICANYPNVSVDVLDYKAPCFLKYYSVKNQISKNPVKSILKISHFLIKRHRFNQFIKKYIALSDRAYYADDIAQANDKYDLFIVGSDQVWNPGITNSDLNYWLLFADDAKRCSYAASMGVTVWPDDIRSEAVRLLATYKGISVREETAKTSLIEMNVHPDVHVNIDPALLLNSTYWHGVCNQVKKHEKKYILLFEVNFSLDLLKKAKQFADDHQMKLIYIGPYTKADGVNYVPSPGVEDLLAYFRDAEYIYTNSFHGTVFSLHFHRQFFSHLNNKDAKNSRITDLLDRLSLNSRLDENNIEQAIAWDFVDAAIDREREKSNEYLESVISQ